MNSTPARVGRAAAACTIALVLAVALGGCVSSPSKPAAVADAAAAPVFYPTLPDAPRIQYLTTLASERDLGDVRDGFTRFVLGKEEEARRLAQPYGSALFGGKLYVADTAAAGVAIFDLAQRRFSLLTGNGNGRFKRPVNVRIDADGTKYVTDAGREQILVYDRDDRFVGAFGRQGEFKPVDVAIVDERLYVTDVKHHQVHVLDKRSGRTLFTFGRPGSGPGELFHPTNLAVAPDGDIHVVDTSNFRVQRFTREGEAVETYGGVGTTSGSFARPKGIAIDRAGRVYVGDAAFENLQLFSREGRLLMFFGQPGDAAEGLSLPAGVTIDYEHVELFRRHADPRFAVEYLILVASQFGPNKVDVFGFGKMAGMDYPADEIPPSARRE